MTISKKSATLGDSETITARIGDNVGVDSALAQIKDSQGQYLAVMALNDTGLSGDGAANDGTWGYQWDTTSKPDGNYNITLVASDKSGNFSQVNGNADFSLASKVTGVKIGDAAACKQILNNGPSSDKLDVVFIPCGFGNDMQSFETAANAAVDKMFTVTQFSDNKQKFNITLAEVSDMACSDTLSADMDNDAVRFREAALPCNPDATIVLKKGGQDGGISLPGSRIVFMLAADPFLAAHELGHAYFRLNDEYSYGCTAADLKTSANCDDSPGCPKWKGLDGAKCVAGCTCEGNYRSSQDSVMVDPQNSTQFSPAAAKYVLSIFNLFK